MKDITVKTTELQQKQNKLLEVIDGPLYDIWLEKITNGLFKTSVIIGIPLFFYLFITLSF
ncbi:hypothetical protein [Litchfieldia alkalitelluris]|uniref:hypothetical protein n=1 Tax=Litchfieldia alkalitelluris TaxID=304268 RepID=UPI000996768B|nr:hypothetical protein [Litchfieldia alkalitelluris]